MRPCEAAVPEMMAAILFCSVARCRAEDGRPSSSRDASTYFADAVDVPVPSIAVWIYNYARVPEFVLADAQHDVARIFAGAGVEVSWVRCPVSAEDVRAHPACQNGMYANELALEIFRKSEDPSLHLDRPKGRLGDHYFGWADVFTNGQYGHYAYIFYDQVLAPENRWRASESQVLATVAAHELGHLLLRSGAHSPSGLMRERWDRDDLLRAAWGRLRFAPIEAAHIRAEVHNRMIARAGD